MKARLFLGLAAMVVFLAVPVFAQHGHGSSGGDGMHGSSHSSSHDAEHGDHGKDGDDHGSKHGSGHGHKSAAQLLAQNPKLSAKLQSLLPPGTNLQQAAQGFKNLGQFVAAVHVSKNLGIPFGQLKAKMTGPPAESLGKAVHDLQPSVNAKAAVKAAEREAKQDLHDADRDAEKHDADDANDAHNSDMSAHKDQ